MLTRGEYLRDDDLGPAWTNWEPDRAYRLPGLVFFLVAVYGVAGFKNYLALRFVQCVLLAVLNVILLRTGTSLFGRRIAICSVVLNLLSQELIFWAAKPSTEFLYTFLLVIYVGLMVSWWDRGGWPRLALGAFSVGLASLTRPVALAIAALTAAVMLFYPQGRSWKSRTGSVAFFSVVFSLTLSPWLVRNWLMFDRLIMNTNGGHTLYMANSFLAPAGTQHYNAIVQDLTARIRSSSDLRERAQEAAPPEQGRADAAHRSKGVSYKDSMGQAQLLRQIRLEADSLAPDAGINCSFRTGHQSVPKAAWKLDSPLRDCWNARGTFRIHGASANEASHPSGSEYVHLLRNRHHGSLGAQPTEG